MTAGNDALTSWTRLPVAIRHARNWPASSPGLFSADLAQGPTLGVQVGRPLHVRGATGTILSRRLANTNRRSVRPRRRLVPGQQGPLVGAPDSSHLRLYPSAAHSWSRPALRPATGSTTAHRCRGTRSQLRRSRRSCERRLRLGNHPRDDLRGLQHVMDAAGALASPRYDLVHVSCLDRCLQDVEEALGIPAR